MTGTTYRKQIIKNKKFVETKKIFFFWYKKTEDENKLI